jgi:hypothetical protein
VTSLHRSWLRIVAAFSSDGQLAELQQPGELHQLARPPRSQAQPVQLHQGQPRLPALLQGSPPTLLTCASRSATHLLAKLFALISGVVTPPRGVGRPALLRSILNRLLRSAVHMVPRCGAVVLALRPRAHPEIPPVNGGRIGWSNIAGEMAKPGYHNTPTHSICTQPMR